MEPNVLLSDFTLNLYGGVGPATIATGTTSGAKIALSLLGLGPIRKLTFQLFATQGTAAGVVGLFLQTATAQNGTYASIAGASVSISVSATNSLFCDQIEIRSDLLADLGLGAGAYIQPVVTVATTATPAFLEVTGWNLGIQPARRLLSVAGFNNVVVNEVDILGLTASGPTLQSP